MIEGTVGGHYLDEWGAANMGSDKNEGVCLGRAKDIWEYCKNGQQQPVKATFLDTGKSATYPDGGMMCTNENETSNIILMASSDEKPDGRNTMCIVYCVTLIHINILKSFSMI